MVRIISGSARRILLKTPPGTDTRPTQDRVKETLFNIIQASVPGSDFLDLFAGSGAIGLEAASRGAGAAVFVDNDRRAGACIQENIGHAKLKAVCEVKRMEAVFALRAMEGRPAFDIIYMDPPYGRGLEKKALFCLARSSLCGEDTMIIAETSRDLVPEGLAADGFEIFRVKEYKASQHIFLRKRGDVPVR